MTRQENKTIRLITTKSACCPAGFTLAHRRIFSYLAYRSRVGQGDSQRELARQTVTDSRTTKNVLAFLAERKLVVRQNGKWHADEPLGEFRKWFAENKAPKYQEHWSDRFFYSSLLVPRRRATAHPGSDKRFTINHAHVYSILRSLANSDKRKLGMVERIGVSRISRMLNGLSTKTIRGAMRLLESLALIMSYQEGAYETIHVKPVSDAHGHLFEKAKRSSRNENDERPSDQQEVRFRIDDMQSIYDDCRREGFPIGLSKDVTLAAWKAGIDSMAFDGYSELASVEHAKNRLAGKVSVEHHGYLLKHKLEQVRNQQDRIEEQMMAPIVAAPPKSNDSQPAQSQDTGKPSPRSERKRPQPVQPSEALERQIGHEMVHTKAWLRLKLGRAATAADIVATTQDGRMAAWSVDRAIAPCWVICDA